MIVHITMTNDQFKKSNLCQESFFIRLCLGLAHRVALLLHFGQTRRYGNRAVEHPMAVAHMVKPAGLLAQIIAILHDAIEDAPECLKWLAKLLVRMFGRKVQFGVYVLTNWTGDDRQYFQMIATCTKIMPVIAIVKLADKLHVITVPYGKTKRDEMQYFERTQQTFIPLMEECRLSITDKDGLSLFDEMLAELTYKVSCQLQFLRNQP